MGPFTPDVACHTARLIVEADGGQHGGPDDARRDAWFESQGYRVLRFWNNDIFNNEEGVLTAILSALQASVTASSRDGRAPLPNRSPTRGEGRPGG
jgi:very-short-patch-repair endonuclease